MDEQAAATGEALSAAILEQVVSGGDLTKLSPEQRGEYYGAVCRSLGLNPLTKPFEYLTLNGKLRLYALRDCTDQLRRRHGISITLGRQEVVHQLYVVVAQARMPDGREDASTGVVDVTNLKGEALANALMKAETKAKRRVTLSIAGLGWLDESEVEALPTLAGSPAAHPTEDQIGSLIELGKAAGRALDDIAHDMRRLMDLPRDAPITRRYLRDHLTMRQYTAAWEGYEVILRGEVEQAARPETAADDDVPLGGDAADDTVPLASGSTIAPPPIAEDPPPGDDRPTGASARQFATPAQVAELKFYAQKIGNDAYADVQDTVERHGARRVPLAVYEVMLGRLQARLSAGGLAGAAEA